MVQNYRLKNNRFWPKEEHGDREELLLSLVQTDRLKSLLKDYWMKTSFYLMAASGLYPNTTKNIPIR